MIYLDSAATTFQKPAAVQRAVVRAMRTMSSPGRGGYAAAQQADELLFRCRSAAAELFSVPSSEQVVFTMNATHGLNIAIKSLVRPCGRVVVSGYEHNAVTRPLHALGAEVIVAAAPLFRRRRRSKPSSARLRMSPIPLSARMSPMSSALFYQLSASRSSAAAQACRSSSTRLNPRARCRSTFPRSRPHSLPCRGIRDFTARRGRGCCSVAATRSRSLRAAQAANRCARACQTFFPTVWRQGRTTFLASRGSKRASPSCARNARSASCTTAARSSVEQERGSAKFQMYTDFSRWSKLAGRGLIVHGGRPFARKCCRGDGKARYRAARGAALCAVRAQNGGDFARRNGAAERFRL